MDFVLIFPLILAFLSTGQCNPEVTDLKCYSKCPIGYHKVDGNCHNSSAPNRCRKCQGDTFTEIENAVEKCRRCKPCGHLQMVIRPCAFNHDTVCDCKDKYFNADRGDTLNCQPCNCKNCPGYDSADYKKKCLPCEWCTPSTTTPTPTPTSTTPSATTSTFTTVTASGATASKMTSNPSMIPLPHPSTNQLTWMILAGVVMIFVMLVWLPLLCSSTYRVFCCPCFSANKDLQLPLEDLRFSEQRSHQDSCPTTLVLNISEETPMMNLSPATSERPVHIGPILPDAEHKAARQDEQSELWPAIVLYAIIKEVPLRRWKEFLRLLSVADQQLERVELEAGLGSMERQYQMLRLWSQRSSASLSDVFSALHYMDLSGCAQLLQESLERLQWRPEEKQGAMQDT